VGRREEKSKRGVDASLVMVLHTHWCVKITYKGGILAVKGSLLPFY